jgi:hypothetical protein
MKIFKYFGSFCFAPNGTGSVIAKPIRGRSIVNGRELPMKKGDRMTHPYLALPDFLADLQWLYEQALEKDQLAVALRIKELQAKHALHKQELSLQDLSDEALQALLSALDRAAGEPCNNASLKNKDQKDQR